MKYQFIISGEIGVAFDWWTGQRGTTAEQVKNFLDAHKDEDVDIAVCSPGGYVDSGLQIYQYIKNHGRVHVHILGMTASAATFLTMGAKEVDMVDGSLMMIHNVSTHVTVWQAANKEQLDQLISEMQKERKDLDTIDKVIASLYAKRNGKSVDDCLEKMTAAAWMSPQDALDFGLIDRIVEDEDVKKKSNRYGHHFQIQYSRISVFLPFLGTRRSGLPPSWIRKVIQLKVSCRRRLHGCRSDFQNFSPKRVQTR